MHVRRLLYSSSLYLLANLASRAIGFAMIPVYARYLTPAEYGLVELIELTIQVVSISFGLQSIGGAMVRIYHDTDAAARKAVISTAMLGTAAGNLVIAAIGFAFAGPLSEHILHTGAANTGLLRAGFLAMILSNWIEVALVYQRLRDRAGLYMGYCIAQLVTMASLNIVFIVHFRMGVWGFVLSKIIACSFGAAVLGISVLYENGLHWCGTAAGKMAQFGAPLILANLAFFIIHFSDRFFLSGFRNLAQVGTYALAYRFAFLVTFLVGEPFGKVWSVNLYAYASTPGWQERFARVARYLMAALCFVGLGVCLFGRYIISWMTTPAYFEAALVLPILVGAYVFREAGDFFRDTLLINKRSRLVGVTAAGAALVNLVCNLLLIQRFGMYGAAWATLITWLAYMVCCWTSAVNEHRIPFRSSGLLVPAVLATVLFYSLRSLPEIPPAAHVALELLWLGLFAVLLWISGFLPRQDKALIRGKLLFARQGLNAWVRQRA